MLQIANYEKTINWKLKKQTKQTKGMNKYQRNIVTT